MNTQFKILMAFFALALSAGCASESGGSGGNAAVPDPCAAFVGACVSPTTPTATPIPSSGGSTVALNLVSTAELGRMFYNSNPNNPTNVTISLNVASSSDSVVISYVDGGIVHQAGLGTVHPNGSTSDKSFNKWYTDSSTNKQVWKGFFQDQYGAIVIIIDKFISQGDGQAGNIVGGSIWFQNFNRYYPNYGTQGPLKMCWQISMGPYDCRSFLVNDNVSPASSLYPNNHGPDANMNYEKLGDFTGISKSAAGF
jgi:hypothetical protein